MAKKVLLAGESWMSYTTHVKGFNAFYTSSYETGEKWLKEALEEGGYDVEFMPNHLVSEHFPFTVEELSKYRCVILSDVGSNTLLLPHATFTRSEIRPQPLHNHPGLCTERRGAAHGRRLSYIFRR